MVSIKDVPQDKLVERIAKYLKDNVPQVKPPQWAIYVKTGRNKDRPPQNDDWWYFRAAAVLRRVYLNGPVGLGSLRSSFSYRAKIGPKARSERTAKAGGAVIRNILHQLEAAGLIERTSAGRVITPKGRSLMDKLASELFKELKINVKVFPQ
ncbi:30S ribosomal protein S19e [Caldivirga maquilingensis]|uniref:Small ribosomal subunit protein eS19 n=1 Tax=Caldivirga maquilingensis (strain ATCC 700844 / DSM 13496 / JCM 10307 / IC-167) TaxID=397948 RepID=A8MBL0_CALMQ|nr:30S ribosomal protein S19e [Caldivirga maquilingensis]ABW02743.1 Ribosomal protein S19e [Caldivirga maquilingensis IC-167]